MDIDHSSLIVTSLIGLPLGWLSQNFGIKLSHHFKLLDKPTPRRRHSSPTPIIGGLGILLTWSISLLVYSYFEPKWFQLNSQSIYTFIGSCLALMTLGLIDDIWGLAPLPKLIVEFLAAFATLTFEPQIHALCVHWEGTLGIFIWPLAAIWIVGITNAVNLIDGLDGLAGGTSLLVAMSILTLSVWTGPTAAFGIVTISLIIPPLIGFLIYNWAPAKIFLGDNGSLPLGFLLANASLICRPQNKSWIMLASLVLMLGYPILDTSLAVIRRFIKGAALFKADRSHLHNRILRLGLSVPQTAGLLLSITIFLQASALCINLMSQPSATLGICIVLFSIFTLLYLIRGIEKWRVNRLYKSFALKQKNLQEYEPKLFQTLELELEPLLEAAMYEEKTRYNQLLIAFELLIKTLVREQDIVLLSDQRVTIVFYESHEISENEEAIKQRFEAKIQTFLDLFSLQCSLSRIPFKFEKRTILVSIHPKLKTGSNLKTA